MGLARVFMLGALLGVAPWVRAGLIVPALESRPGAGARVYLDFDGDVTATWSTYSPGVTPAYDIDGDAANFSGLELDRIREIWARVAEKYSPFDINVTTIDPVVYNDRETERVVIGGSGAWVGQVAGGISTYGGFSNGESNTCWVFSGNLQNGDTKRVGEASAHEAGHAFGLYHQSTYLGVIRYYEYNPGTAEKAPVMGLSYNSNRGLWWYGQGRAYNVMQDDMAVIASSANGFGYRADDHPSSAATAEALAVGGDWGFSAAGVIEKTSDEDWFRFTTPGGYASLRADVAGYGAMLDLSLALYDAGGTLVQLAATSSLGEAISEWLAAGTYELAVRSAGSYGDVGQYTISGTLVPETGSVAAVLGVLAAGMRRRRGRSCL